MGLIELLRSKLRKAEGDLSTLEKIEIQINSVKKTLQDLQSEVPEFYVFGEAVNTTEKALKEIKAQVESSLSEAKTLIVKAKEEYLTSQQLVPTDISQKLASLELLTEIVSGAMEEKDRQFKRARTIRTEYYRNTEEVQGWIENAEVKIQDRSVEPLQLKEYLSQIQSEIGGINDKLECLTNNGNMLRENTENLEEKELIEKTISTLTERLSEVKNWLEEKKHQVGESLDSWQRFMNMYQAVRTWIDERQMFLMQPLQLSNLTEARTKLQEYSTAVKSCKQATKNLNDMGKELELIEQVSSVGDLPEKLEEVKEAKGEVESQLMERHALLQETTEEWEQCEKKMKDVRAWIEKSKQALESPQNKKRPLRDQLNIREKMMGDITIQKTKISMSVEKLQVHFRSGVGGDSKITEAAEEIIKELDQLTGVVKEQIATLETCLTQMDQYQQEIQQLRQQIIQVEQQLRVVLSPTYLPHDRDKAVEEQNACREKIVALQTKISARNERIKLLTQRGTPDSEPLDS